MNDLYQKFISHHRISWQSSLKWPANRENFWIILWSKESCNTILSQAEILNLLCQLTYHNCFNLFRVHTESPPTYKKITNTVSTTTFFGLCTCKGGILALVGDHSTVPLTWISCNTVFSKSQNARKAGTLCKLLT